MRIVFDTNVVVAGLVVEGLCREILEVHMPEHVAVLSEPLWDELLTTLQRKFDLAADDLPFLGLYRQHAQWVQPVKPDPAICRDPDDDWVLATAQEGSAEAIVTGDVDLLTLGRFGAIRLWTPRQFLENQP